MKRTHWILIVLALAATIFITGCGDDAKEEAASTPAAEAAHDANVQTAQVHDCDGGCGMTAVPVDKLEEINGKYYCAGCAKKVHEAAGDEAKEATDHPHG